MRTDCGDRSLEGLRSVPGRRGARLSSTILPPVKARLMLCVVTSTSNSSKRNTAISSWYILGFSMRRSSNALSIGGVTLRGRPTPFGGALVSPKHRKFDRIDQIERVLHRATSAI